MKAESISKSEQPKRKPNPIVRKILFLGDIAQLAAMFAKYQGQDLNGAKPGFFNQQLATTGMYSGGTLINRDSNTVYQFIGLCGARLDLDRVDACLVMCDPTGGSDSIEKQLFNNGQGRDRLYEQLTRKPTIVLSTNEGLADKHDADKKIAIENFAKEIRAKAHISIDFGDNASQQVTAHVINENILRPLFEAPAAESKSEISDDFKGLSSAAQRRAIRQQLKGLSGVSEDEKKEAVLGILKHYQQYITSRRSAYRGILFGRTYDKNAKQDAVQQCIKQIESNSGDIVVDLPPAARQGLLGDIVKAAPDLFVLSKANWQDTPPSQ